MNTTNETYTVEYCALSYAYQVLNANYPEALNNTVKALYLYNEKANTYFGETNNGGE